jgi:hypothetical protein
MINSTSSASRLAFFFHPALRMGNGSASCKEGIGEQLHVIDQNHPSHVLQKIRLAENFRIKEMRLKKD